MKRALDEIAREHSSAWKGKLRMESAFKNNPTGVHTVDQYGKKLEDLFGPRNRGMGGEMKPSWPPLGCSIVVEVADGENFRHSWMHRNSRPAQLGA